MGAKEHPAITLVAATLGFGVVQLDVSVVNVAIKPISTDLGGGITGVQWVVSAYTVTFAALILSAGALGDRIGAKRVFISGFVIFTVASIACGLAPSLGVLIASRTVQGVGAAVLVPCSLSLLSHAYTDADARARAVGLWAAGASVALSAGPLIGGLLIASLSWRWIFFINVPIGLVGIALTARFVTETSRSRARGIDLPGQTASIVALGALAAATVEGGKRGFGDPFVLAGFALAVVAGWLFIRIESRRPNPMLPLSLFDSVRFRAASAIGLLVNIAFYGLIFVFSLFFQTEQKLSALATGLAFVPTTVAVLLGNLLASRLVAKIGERWVLLGGAVLIAVSALGLVIVNPAISYVLIVGQLIAMGFGLGMIVPTMTAVLLGSADPSQAGIASGTLNSARQTGSVIGVALFGSFAAASIIPGLRASLFVTVALAIAIALLAAGIRPGSAGSAGRAEPNVALR